MQAFKQTIDNAYKDSYAMTIVHWSNRWRFAIPSNAVHRPAATAIKQGKLFEPETISYLVNNELNGNIIHAGAFFGDFLPILSKFSSPTRWIWSFEPVRSNFKAAVRTIALNDLSNVSISHGALYDSNGYLRMKTQENDMYLGGASYVIDPENDYELMQHQFIDDELVPCFTIDGFDPLSANKISNLRIIHLDVEGSENQVLRGAWTTIQYHKPKLILETVPKTKFFNRLIEAGYKKTATLDKNTLFEYKP